jgi:hypothetical protein
MDDPDRVASERSRQGQSRELQQQRGPQPAPSRGGAPGYPEFFRDQDLVRAANGDPTVASTSSIRRWIQRIQPHRMTGNRERSRLVGYDQFLLCLCYLTWPHVQADEAASFVYRNGGGLYERPIIYRRCKELKMSRKRASTEAHQAYTPRNILRCQLFWSQPPPIGVHQTPRRLMIDFDECGLELQSCNRRHGMAFSGLRVRKRGNYSRDTKLTVIMVEAILLAAPACDLL